MLNFAEAMQAVLNGKRARRSDWNRPAYVELQTRGDMPFIAMVMKNGVVGPYPPSHCDMLSKDWAIAE